MTPSAKHGQHPDVALAKEALDGGHKFVGLRQDAQVTAPIDVQLCIGYQAAWMRGLMVGMIGSSSPPMTSVG